ncbi:unnamed protein product [Ceutorhynchus assimilis]|uniref:Uncharacterized protein n=1 Tax=Ceutorhynchus assimilis TaxID=467358 RepID=A0A9N9MKN9_9CUCU|nr:unnamed protein product [Ceutorhynchus assimilis]
MKGKEEIATKKCIFTDEYLMLDCTYKVYGILNENGKLNKDVLKEYFEEQVRRNPDRLEENLIKIKVLETYKFDECLKVDWLLRPNADLKMFCFKWDGLPEVVLEMS